MENVYDALDRKGLKFILPSFSHIQFSLKENLKVCLIVHMHYYDMIDFHWNYISNVPKEIDVFITSSNYKIKKYIENKILSYNDRQSITIIEKPNRGRDISAFLVTCRKLLLEYDYIGFVHDKGSKSLFKEKDVWFWDKSLWDNMIGSSCYIRNVISLLQEKEKIGVVVPPLVLRDSNVGAISDTWCNNFKNAKSLAKRLGLRCDIREDKPPITIGTCFWAKRDALRKLLSIDWEYEDFDPEPLANDGTLSHSIERIIAYVAQDAGYDTGWIMTDQYATDQITYCYSVIKNRMVQLRDSMGIESIPEADWYLEIIDNIKQFAAEHNRLFIFGCGKYGKKCLRLIQTYNIIPTAFVVSDLSKVEQNVEFPIYSVYDIDIKEDDGFIIALSQNHLNEGINTLKNQNVKEFFVFSP